MRNIAHAPTRAQSADAEREIEIHRAHRSLVVRTTLKGKATAWRRLVDLARARSPAAIARLEAERGLVRPS